MTFTEPIYFLLLLLLIPYIIWYVQFRNRGKRKMEASITFSDASVYRNAPMSWRVRLIYLPML